MLLKQKSSMPASNQFLYEWLALHDQILVSSDNLEHSCFSCLTEKHLADYFGTCTSLAISLRRWTVVISHLLFALCRLHRLLRGLIIAEAKSKTWKPHRKPNLSKLWSLQLTQRPHTPANALQFGATGIILGWDTPGVQSCELLWSTPNNSINNSMHCPICPSSANETSLSIS